jgi:hypothetical protein
MPNSNRKKDAEQMEISGMIGNIIELPSWKHLSTSFLGLL